MSRNLRELAFIAKPTQTKLLSIHGRINLSSKALAEVSLVNAAALERTIKRPGHELLGYMFTQ